MSDLDPAHVEAVARAMVEVAYYDIAVEFSLTFLATGDNRAWVPPHWEGDAMVKAEHYAKALMESTDPAVHAALVRAGVLREDERWTTTDETGATIHVGFGQCSRTPRRRYVTRWEDA